MAVSTSQDYGSISVVKLNLCLTWYSKANK